MASGVPPFNASVNPLPSRPLTVPPTTCWSVLQLTVTDVTLAPPTVPLAPDSVQVWSGPVGWVALVTANVVPLGSWVGKVNDPEAVTGRSSPPLSRRISPAPASPTTTPPTV